MKKITLLIIIILIILFGNVGCVKRDNMEDIEIITSSYPLEYLITKLYGEHATIENIFPDDERIDSYTFNEKQYKKFSKKDLFIYNGKNDSDIALQLVNRNNNLLLIDTTLGMEYTYGIEELWLDPSNLLMMALNIKKGLEEYISNSYLIKEIDNSYQDLKVTLSELDAEIKLTVQNADATTIIATDNSLKYLEKYGLEIIILNDDALDKIFEEVKVMVKNGNISYLYTFDGEELSDKINEFIKETGIKQSELYRLDSVSDEQRNNDKDYVAILEDNLDLLKLEIYDEE